MIQLLITLLGLLFPANHVETNNGNHNQTTVQNNITPEDTNGENGNTPPKK